MQASCPRRRKSSRDLKRILRIDRRSRVVAAKQAHALTAEDVDGGNDNHAAILCRKARVRRASPAEPPPARSRANAGLQLERTKSRSGKARPPRQRQRFLSVICELEWDGDVLGFPQRFDDRLQCVLVLARHPQLVALDSNLDLGAHGLDALAKVLRQLVSDPRVEHHLELSAALPNGLRLARLEELWRKLAAGALLAQHLERSLGPVLAGRLDDNLRVLVVENGLRVLEVVAGGDLSARLVESVGQFGCFELGNDVEGELGHLADEVVDLGDLEEPGHHGQYRQRDADQRSYGKQRSDACGRLIKMLRGRFVVWVGPEVEVVYVLPARALDKLIEHRLARGGHRLGLKDGDRLL